MFKIIDGGYYESKKYTKTDGRTLNRYELELSVSGTARSFFNENMYPREHGDVFFAKPGDVRKSVGDFECFYIHFDCNDLSFREKYLNNLPTCQKSRNFSELKNTLQQVVMMKEKILQNDAFKEEYEKLIDIKLSEVFINLYIQAAGSIEARCEYASNISRACLFIDENFKNHITIDDIAAAAMLSPSFTYVQFKKEIGQTPHKYLLNKRLDHACLRLIFTDKSVAAISDECGFSNPNYLNNVFKKIWGITPLQYRKKFRKEL